MPCLWGQHNKSQVFLSLLILDATNVTTNPANPLTGITLANLPSFAALIDTGAERTMISPNVVAKLGLNPIGKIPILSAAETSFITTGTCSMSRF